jgi:hypothetical protein
MAAVYSLSATFLPNRRAKAGILEERLSAENRITSLEVWGLLLQTFTGFTHFRIRSPRLKVFFGKAR